MLGEKPILGESYIGEWNSSFHSISLYRSASDHFLAHIQDQAGTKTEIDSAHIKCGILGKTPHIRLIKKIDQLGKETIKEHISVCCYPVKEQPTEVWVFEARQGAALWIKKAKENLKQRDAEKEKAINWCQQALKNFKEALKLQKSTKGCVEELESVILYLEKELFLLQIKRDLSLYLSPEERAKFNEVIETYKAQEDLFSELSEYLKAQEESKLSPYQLFLSALLDEHSNNPASAIQKYLLLAEHHPDPLPCFKKAEELVKQTIKSDPFAFPHFLEKLDRNSLIQLRQTTQYPEDLARLILQKDAVRMTFEKCLATLNQHSLQTKAPTCFICFNAGEADVGKWLEQVLIPDLHRMGIQLFIDGLNSGKVNLNNFQNLIRESDQVIIVGTPGLKRKCDERKTAPMGVAQEIRFVKERYNDPNKYTTTFLLYLKGSRKESCPSEFFEPILGFQLNKSQESSVLSYYENAFEFFGGMRNIPREISREVKKKFLLQANKIFAGEIDQKELEKWRQARQFQIESVSKAAQEQVIKMTKMVHLPLPPKDFTGRQQELKDLHTACQNHHRVAITGLGGVGKTALAIKYANDHQADYQFIYHIPAGTSQQIRDGFLQLADDLHLPRSEKIEERLELLKRRLDQLEQKYLLIFDGVDQVEAFEELSKYLPERGSCLLLTSRMPEQSRIRDFELIELRSFSLEDAVNYLLHATGSDEKEKARELAEHLGTLPLAWEHVARYIRSRQISIHQYIQEFDRFQLKLFEDKHLNFLTKEEKTILTTWSTSLNAIEILHECPLAKELITFFAFLGQAPIPLRLIKKWFKTTHPAKKELNLVEAIRQLFNYSMIESPSPGFYQVHPLLQQVIQHQMNNPQQVFEQAVMTLRLQLEKFQADDVNTWNLTKQLIPHALSLFKRQDLMARMASEQQHEFMNQLGNIYYALGNIDQALEVWQESLKVARFWLKNHPQLQQTTNALAKSYDGLGMSWLYLGKNKKALKYLQKALKIWVKLNEVGHSTVATSYNNIGLIYEKLGGHVEALQYFQKSLMIRYTVHGERHSDVGTSYYNIGLCLESLRKYEEALKYHQKALAVRQMLCKEEHPSVAMSYNSIGEVFRVREEYVKALEYHKKALMIWLKVYGKGHPSVALSYSNIGSCFESMGRFDDALRLYQEALKIRLEVYGENHFNVALSHNNIGLCLNSMGRLDEALDYQQKALKTFLKVYGEGHPVVGTSYSNLGHSLLRLRKYEEALEYYQKTLNISLKLYDEEHFVIGMNYSNLGSCLIGLRKFDKALEYYQKALKILLKAKGEEHPNVGTIYHNLGNCFWRLRKYDEALEYYQKALTISLKIYGEEHPTMVALYNNLGNSLEKLKKYEDALEYYQKVLKISLKMYGEEDLNVVMSFIKVGQNLRNIGKNNEALDYFQKAVKIYEKAYSSSHPKLLEARRLLSSQNSIGEWKSGSQTIALYRSASHQFLAHIQDQTGAPAKMDSAYIKCGILGTTPHNLLIQKIDQLDQKKIKEHIAVFGYPFDKQPTEVWVFEAVQGAASWIKEAKKILYQRNLKNQEESIKCCQKAILHLKTALAIQENQKGDTTDLNSAILQLTKELLLLRINDDPLLYLPSAQEREALTKIIEIYSEEDIFSSLSEYLKAYQTSTFSPCQLFLAALMDEYSNRPISAIQNYLRLAEHHSDPLPCFKKAEELAKQTLISDPFALPHFLEKLDRNKLIQLRSTTHYSEDLERLLLQKDAVRMTFEKCLATLKQHSPQTKASTCFICFNSGEADVVKWLGQVLVPDLNRMGIQLISEDSSPGKVDGNLIQKADQVIIVCTPELKRQYQEHKKSLTRVEIDLAKMRYLDSDKNKTTYLLFLKGSHKTSCPDAFFEPILGTTLTFLENSKETSLFSYYANAFELFGEMWNIPRTISRQVKDNFLLQAKELLDGKINQEELEKWRQTKRSQIESDTKVIQGN